MDNFKAFTGWQYLLIDAANHYGLDKLLFEERIEFMTKSLNDLEVIAASAETKPLYLKAIMAIRKAQKGLPTGHLVGLDACCSGIQVMSALTGCVAGATATGLVTPGVRSDAYTYTTQVMQDTLGDAISISRKDAKQAVMTSYYGSKATPKQIFGEDTPELAAFYQAARTVAPGAWDLLQTLLASWQPYALEHSWKMPDGFDVRIKVMSKKETRIEVDELGGASFTYEYYENQGQKKGLSNVANMTHSMDAWVLRSMHRRCNYDREVAERAARLIEIELIRRSMSIDPDGWIPAQPVGKAKYYIEQYERSTLADIVILPWINEDSVTCMSTAHLHALAGILTGMLQYKPFPLVTVHDEFKAHANNMNWVRWQYREIMAEIAESDVLSDLLTQVFKTPCTYDKLSFNLPELIRGSEYALC